MRRSGAAALTAVLLALVWGAGASEESGEPRYIRRFGPDPTEWRRVRREPARAELGRMEIWEVSQHPPGAQPTPEQQEAADRLIEHCRQAVRKHGWEDFQKGLGDGFQLLRNDRNHYYNEEHILDDRVLDPERPEFLMYSDTPEGKKLVGFMFYVAGRPRGPQIGGPLTVWHYHLFAEPVCRLGLGRGHAGPDEGLLAGAESDPSGSCLWGRPTLRSPEMLHVWLIRHPMGPFGTKMHLPPEWVAQELEKRDAEGSPLPDGSSSE